MNIKHKLAIALLAAASFTACAAPDDANEPESVASRDADDERVDEETATPSPAELLRFLDVASEGVTDKAACSWSYNLNDSGAVDYLTVCNRCSSSRNAKVVLANAPDFACRTYPPNGCRSLQWAFPGRFDGVRACN